MKTSDNKDQDLKNTLNRLRARNLPTQLSSLPIAEEDNMKWDTQRQRVSSGHSRVATVERQNVLHAVMRALLSGEITQGQALKKLRIEVLGLKQDEYAKLVDVSRKTLSEVENDKGNYTADIINKIFKPFGLETGLVPIAKKIINSLLS